MSNGSAATNDAGASCVTIANGPGGSGCAKGAVYAGEEWQCVELINRLYLTRGWIAATWWGNGSTLKDNIPAGLTWEANGSITYLNPGDVITFSYTADPAGHAAIINSVSGTTVQIVNQNTSAVYSSATYSNKTVTMAGWKGYTVQGVVHAPGAGSAGGGSSSSGSSSLQTHSYLTLNKDADGRIEIVGIGNDGSLNGKSEVGANVDAWNGWYGIPGGATSISSVRMPNGRLVLFYVGPDGNLYYRIQTAPNNGWGPEEQMPIGFKAVTAALNADGRIEIIGIGKDGSLNGKSEIAANVDGWNAWYHIPGGGISDSAISTSRRRSSVG